ncbi:MAG: thiol-disulfide isomerase/thioredoxin [Limisphaerales bacterium]
MPQIYSLSGLDSVRENNVEKEMALNQSSVVRTSTTFAQCSVLAALSILCAGLLITGCDGDSDKTVSYMEIHSQGGAEVDVKSLMPAGKITIVDFYADWCGPCRKISPQLESIAKENPDVVLRKVDIVRWGTPVTAQYKIRSVPNIRVYGMDKQQIGESTHDLGIVQTYIAQAK